MVLSYNQSTESGIKFNVRGSISGIMCHNNRFSPVQWKTAEIKRRISSVKSAELFALDYGAGQLERTIQPFFDQADYTDFTD